MHPAPGTMTIRNIVFDLGGVLIDWNPRHLYRKLIDDESHMEWFLREVCHQRWNEQQDGGRSTAEATEEKIAEFPEYADLIRAFYGRWEEMIGGAFEDTVAILHALGDTGRPLYALSNWSAELFPIARRRFDFLARFRAIVLSGEEGVIKPEPEIFHRLFTRHGLAPHDSLFIDDVAANVLSARRLGMQAIHYRSAAQLRAELAHLSLLID
jgi:2-haloacid dehalogenase